ncbi:MAG: alpha-ketoglutarate-dependent dioxygenase AlkB [Frankiaceae bacterium]|nr:alpha-ketoglutarate-dependent dioxygenase AlkB [Frankiaceae bacterium]
MKTGVSWQPSLFDGGLPTIDVSYAGLHRIQLDATSWVDYCPGWLAGSDAVFEHLAATARWQQRTVTMWDKKVLEPRLTAGWTTKAEHAPTLLNEMCELLSARYEICFDRVWVNLYRDGQDSVAWHGDRHRHTVAQPMVATVSLGARRKFQLRRRGGGRIEHTLRPGLGDLVVMGGRCQDDWEHCVPKTASAVGARMSVTIRPSAARVVRT